MFENIQLILNALNDPQYTNLSINQMVVHVANVIELNNLSLKWLLFEMFIYTIYVIITYLYTYTIIFRKFLRLLDTSKHFKTISVKIVKKLINQLVASESISFFGEPLKGLQIMGQKK